MAYSEEGFLAVDYENEGDVDGEVEGQHAGAEGVEHLVEQEVEV